MADTNGSLKFRSPRSSSKALDNKISKPPPVNGHAIKPSRRPATASSRGVFARLFSISARLLTWYAIFTILFRCPPTLDRCDETSPAICVPYFQAKHIVVPHLAPYYNTYAGPYIEAAQPYYDTVDRAVLSPAWGYAKKYGSPAVGQAQALGQAQWEKNVQPQLAKYSALARARYDDTLAPHVERASAAVVPYFEIARTNALQTYHEIIRPGYDFVRPYAWQGYTAASDFTTQTVVPSTVWVWNKTYVFLDGTVWPQLRVLYTETVEPQLVRIGKRLGRYNGTGAGQKTTGSEFASHTIASKASSSFTKPTSSVAASSTPIASAASSAISSAASAISSSVSSFVHQESSTSSPPSRATAAASSGTKFSEHAEQVQAPEPDNDEQERRRIARETVAEDLKAWQEKYHKAADQSAAEIQERVDEIAKKMVRREVRVRGKGLVESLQRTIVEELVNLRRSISTIVGSVVKESATTEQAEEQLQAVIRKAGLEIKQRAKDVRSWHETYDNDMRAQVTAAADSHFSILGSIRDLALQKIGMKWAWMDGVTYKDWAKYHLLKSRFDEWEQDLEKYVVSHPGLLDAQNEGQAVEDRAMELASSAAKELARLKQVAAWKLGALDDSRDFDSESTRAAFEAAGQAKIDAAAAADVADAAAAAAAAASQGDQSAETTAADSGDEPAVSHAEEASAVADEDDESAASATSSATPSEDSSNDETETTTSSEAEAEPTLASSLGVVPDVPEVVANASDPTNPDASDAEAGPIHLTTEQEDEIKPVVDDEEDLADAGSLWAGTELDERDAAKATTTSSAEPADDDEVEATVTPTPSLDTETIASVKPAFLGAAAQEAPKREPVLDDDHDDDDLEDNADANTLKSAGVTLVRMEANEMAATISSVASAAYSVAMSRASEQYDSAVSLISAQMRGVATPLPVHSALLSSVSAVYSSASAAASRHLEDAISSAESVYGAATSKVKRSSTPMPTPTPWAASVEALAASRLSEGIAWAEAQYSSAKSAIGLAAPEPTPASPAEKLLQNAQHNYYAALGAAHARYAEFKSAASAAFAAPTPTPTNLAGSASSVASVVGDSVSSGWDAVVSRVSVQVYGAPTPTPWYDAAAGVAARQYASVSSLVSELLVGKEPSFAESVYARLGDVYSVASATAASVAGGATDAVKSVAGEATDAVKSAGEKVASVASEATERVKSAVGGKDEL